MDKDFKVPKGEILWETIFRKKHTYIVTSKPTRDFYFLYQVDGDKLTKLAKAKTPADFVKYYKEG